MAEETITQNETAAEPEHTALVGEHHHSDTFRIPLIGLEMTLPGGVYTFVFGILGVLTVIEVLAASFGASSSILIVLLLAFAVSKALLVMAFYMHLNRDTVVYRFVLALPLFIAVLSVLFLISTRSSVGLGYR